MNSVTEARAASARYSDASTLALDPQLGKEPPQTASLLRPDYLFPSRQKLPQAATPMTSLLEILPSGVVVLDQRGRIIQANPAAESLLGSGLEGVSWRQVINRNFSPQLDDGHEISLISGRRVALRTCSLRHGSGQLIVLNDLTETRELQQKLSRHERLSAVGRMLSSLAHQIRTPLSAALLHAEKLKRHQDQDPAVVHTADKVLSRLHNIERQIKDMLIYARGKATPTSEVTTQALLELCREAAEELRLPQGGRLDWRLQGQGATLHCNQDALVGAVLNLIENAIQAAPAESDVVISARLSGGDTAFDEPMLIITVDNSGEPIDEALLKQLDEPFVSTKPDGTGLGLSVVRLVSHSHRGQFHLCNREHGGVRAQLRLPVRLNETRPEEHGYAEEICND